MSRNLSSQAALAATQPNVAFVYLCEFDFADEAGAVTRSYTTNAPFDIQWAGNNYIGIGQLLDIQPVKETDDLTANGLSFTLSGIPSSEYNSIALGCFYQGRPCLMRLAILNEQHQIINDPVLLFSGRMDTMQIILGETLTIKINAESVLAAWDKAQNTRFNHAAQTSIAGRSNDLFFNHLENMQSKTIIWGRA